MTKTHEIPVGTVQTPCAKIATVMDCVLCPPASPVRPVLDCACHSQACSPKKQSAIGCSGKGSRWNVSQQLADACKQGWMSDAYEPLLGEWQVWLTEKEEERRKEERPELHKAWVEKFLDGVEGGAGMRHNINKPRPRSGGSPSH